ncbi:MAG TPA: xylulokinase [Candidatus Eisenbergiella merdavium]|uniref:Xylulose kinase n=1 Tax=Candidatus Eisenbergiella merdavium TaxID=2838551 RepID=A0A9D2NI68_9FIRM|nr:xylulokinase [Candidatus Eisenbergiella merdavium]
MKKEYILAHDLGTSGNKAAIYGLDGKLSASVLCGYPTYYPEDGYVEQDPSDWWRAVCRSTRKLLEKTGINSLQIAAVCFSAQMMGCLLTDRQGNALRNMITWADSRARRQEEELVQRIGMKRCYQITGHRPSASYSAAKLLWIKENEPDIYRKAYRMLNAKDYIIHRLTGAFVTDYSDASGTNFFDLEKKVWSREITEGLGLRMDLLPQLHPSTDIAGLVTPAAAKETGLAAGTPVVIGGGDGSCACVGAGVTEAGKTYCALGSSSWISMADKKPVYDPQMRTFNWVHLDPGLYTPCGTMQAAGYSYQWFKNTFCGEEAALAAERGESPYSLINEKAMRTPPGAGGLLYLPYLLGERSPRWNLQARGVFLGMKITTGKGEMARAVMEGVGYNLKAILDIFQEHLPVQDIAMIGGGAKGSEWMQILADIWQKPLLVSGYPEEATSMGAAVCGGVGIGVFPDFRAAGRFGHEERLIMPREEYRERYQELYDVFNGAYDALQETFERLAGIK